MASDSKMFSAYGAAMSGDWESMIEHYGLPGSDLRRPVTYSRNTALHIAVYSEKEQPLKDLLAILPSIDQENLLKRKNKFGNTVLHEATIYGNFEAVKLLVGRSPDLVSITNKFGETPWFTAAEFSEAEIVKLLLPPSQEIVDSHRCCLKSIHRQRSSDNLSILGAAILGQHYETALLLLELDESLHSVKDKNGITALHLLAHSPSAFKSGYPMGILERLVYCCLPVVRGDKVKLQEETLGQARQRLGDLETGLGKNRRGGLVNYLNVLIKGYWPESWLQRLWNEKRKHVFALRLAVIIIQKDVTWNSFERQGDCPEVLSTSQLTGGRDKEEEEQGLGRKKDEVREKEDSSDSSSIVSQTTGGHDKEQHPQASKEGPEEISPYDIISALDVENEQHPLASMDENPLFTATREGIEEIVKGIIKQYPHVIEYLNDMGRSILDVAVIHRKKKIFSFVKQNKIPLARLRLVIDKEDNTLLHHVADMEHHSRGTKPGPALQLQEELQWFEEVREIIPSLFVTLRNKKSKTAEELFNKNHQDQLGHAQKWVKETTQSCSTVAALVATVVFAAAYTVPGGSDAKGTPNFIHSPYFLVFTVSDVVSLASSLTSLVVFLSLLTSPFELEDFRVSIPRKLIIGFTFLFFSVITTMLSFGATILILIQSERKLTTLLLSIAAFLPVLVFAIMQFRLYVSFMGSTLNFHNIITKALPSCLVRRLRGGEKRW